MNSYNRENKNCYNFHLLLKISKVWEENHLLPESDDLSRKHRRYDFHSDHLFPSAKCHSDDVTMHLKSLASNLHWMMCLAAAKVSKWTEQKNNLSKFSKKIKQFSARKNVVSENSPVLILMELSSVWIAWHPMHYSNQNHFECTNHHRLYDKFRLNRTVVRNSKNGI